MFESTEEKMRETGHRSPEPLSADAIVLGAGVAGLVLARELAAEGLRVQVISPPARRGLVPSYALWLDEAEACGVADCLAVTWPSATVRTSTTQRHVLRRTYARVDVDKLLTKLRAQATARGVNFTDTAARAVHHTGPHSIVETENGQVWQGRLVVDATGHDSPFVRRLRDDRPSAQTAFGVLLDDVVVPEDHDAATMMDLRAAGTRRSDASPSFLYLLRPPEGPTLVEETCLVGGPPVDVDELERRLRHRLAAYGIRGREVGQEVVRIPMGGPLPDLDQPLLGFGAAGGMVHPATGYMLAGVLLRARGVARAVAAAFRMGADTNAVARAGWQALWPEDRQAARRLQCFGMELLRTLDGAQQRAFFSAYFQAAQEKWPALMGFQATAAEITAIMEKAFSLFPLPLKMRASLLLTVRHPTLVPQLARTLLGGPPAHRALPPAP